MKTIQCQVAWHCLAYWEKSKSLQEMDSPPLGHIQGSSRAACGDLLQVVSMGYRAQPAQQEKHKLLCKMSSN